MLDVPCESSRFLVGECLASSTDELREQTCQQHAPTKECAGLLGPSGVVWCRVVWCGVGLLGEGMGMCLPMPDFLLIKAFLCYGAA